MKNTEDATRQIRYCKFCGKQKRRREGRLFNEITGEKEIVLACLDEDSLDCVHNHNFEFTYPSKHFIVKKCRTCGYTLEVEVY